MHAPHRHPLTESPTFVNNVTMLRYFLLSLFCFILAADAAEPLPTASLERAASTGSERAQLAHSPDSPVFGANLFSSQQKEVIASAFNPSYVIK